MKNRIKQILTFILLVTIVCNTFFFSISYAHSDDELPDGYKYYEMIKDNDKWNKIRENFWKWAIAQCGAVFHGDMKQITENDEELKAEFDKTWGSSKWRTDNITMITGEGSTTKLKVSKIATQSLLDTIKKANKQPENGGYELVKTVPLSMISSLYFDNTNYYKSLMNLISDNNGMIGLYNYYGSAIFYKVDTDAYFVKQTPRKLSNSDISKEFSPVSLIKNVNDRYKWYSGISNKGSAITLNWNDTESQYYYGSANDTSLFYGLDAFKFFKNSSYESVSSNPLAGTRSFLVTKSGVSIPAFNDLDSLVDYTVRNNLYYTTSSYTGEGKEIIIPMEEVDKIQSGYYEGMYDLLQKMIEQQGNNALTPEQLQKLVDEVAASYGMLKDAINAGFEQQDILIQKNSEILKNIADALNTFFAQEKSTNEKLFSYIKDNATSGIFYKIYRELHDSITTGIFYKTYNEVKDGFKAVTDALENDSGETGGTGGKEGIYAGILSEILDSLKNIKISPSKPVIKDGNGNIWNFLDFATNLADKIAEGSTEALDGFVGDVSEVGGALADVFTQKFPFSIPWDIVAFVSALSATPKTPYYEVPIVLERYGIDEKIVIDLKDFEIISKISRTFLTVIWSMYLMNFTLKFTDVKNKS